MQAPPPTVLVEDFVGPDRTEWKTRVGEKRDTLFPSAVLVVSADGQFEKCRCQIVAHLTPVESRVGHQDHEAAEGQRQEANGHDPVRDPGPARMPGRVHRHLSLW